jgi:hypothetical protein
MPVRDEVDCIVGVGAGRSFVVWVIFGSQECVAIQRPSHDKIQEEL